MNRVPATAFARVALCVSLFAFGCSSEEIDAPLSALDLRSAISGHTFNADPASGPRYLIHFRRNGVAQLSSSSPEFARWYADDEQRLCLQRRDAPPLCAPVYQLNVARFRWGDTVLNNLTGP